MSKVSDITLNRKFGAFALFAKSGRTESRLQAKAGQQAPARHA